MHGSLTPRHDSSASSCQVRDVGNPTSRSKLPAEAVQEPWRLGCMPSHSSRGRWQAHHVSAGVKRHRQHADVCVHLVAQAAEQGRHGTCQPDPGARLIAENHPQPLVHPTAPRTWVFRSMSRGRFGEWTTLMHSVRVGSGVPQGIDGTGFCGGRRGDVFHAQRVEGARMSRSRRVRRATLQQNTESSTGTQQGIT